MAELRDWFTSEIGRLGFAGLEGVYDYLLSMPDGEALDYLGSLLGKEPRIQEFSNAFVRNRAVGFTGASASASASISMVSAPNFWDEVGSASNAQSKKSKRGRGKARATGNKSSGSRQSQKPSFANKVAPKTAQTSEQSKAISNAPVEQARQKIREYRKAQRVVNCIRCGKVERIIREDGACSFCNAAIFSIWEGNKSDASLNAGGSSRSRRATVSQDKDSLPVVLGRYCFPSDSFETSFKKTTAPAKILNMEIDVGAEQNDAIDAGGREGFSNGYYKNSLVNEEELQRCCASEMDNLKKILVKNLPTGPLPVHFDGRLIIDDVTPSVCIFE